MTIQTFSQYLVKSGIFNKGQGLATLQDQMAEAFPVYVDEVLVPAIVTGRPNTEPAAGWHHAIKPCDLISEEGAEKINKQRAKGKVVRLRDVLLALEGIDEDQRDGGWWETSKGVEHGKDIMHRIIQASFLPHDGATLEKQLDIARNALLDLSTLGNGSRMGNSEGNWIAQKALGKVKDLDQGLVFPDPNDQAQMVSDFKPAPVIQNNSTVRINK